jgi:hypothetical protein
VDATDFLACIDRSIDGFWLFDDRFFDTKITGFDIFARQLEESN